MYEHVVSQPLACKLEQAGFDMLTAFYWCRLGKVWSVHPQNQIRLMQAQGIINERYPAPLMKELLLFLGQESLQTIARTQEPRRVLWRVRLTWEGPSEVKAATLEDTLARACILKLTNYGTLTNTDEEGSTTGSGPKLPAVGIGPETSKTKATNPGRHTKRPATHAS